MAYLEPFKGCLESSEITPESVDQVRHRFLIKRLVCIQLKVDRRRDVIVKWTTPLDPWLNSKVPANGMRNRIRANEVVCESTIRDLPIVVWISVPSETRLGRWVKDRVTVEKVFGVETPVPVRLGSLEPALVSQSVFKEVYIGSVPGQEESG